MRLRVGLTGGIAAGKSVVGAGFSALGAVIVDADELAREALAPGTGGLGRVLARFPACTGADGSLDRAALAAVVFRDENARAALDAIVHPIVRRLAAARELQAPADAVVMHEVPLLFETGFATACDATVLVTAPEDVRIERAMQRSGLSREDTLRRMRAQIDPAAARGLATFVIENDGPPERTLEAVRGVWDELQSIVPPRTRPSLA